jgi:hypothetical protein
MARPKKKQRPIQKPSDETLPKIEASETGSLGDIVKASSERVSCERENRGRGRPPGSKKIVFDETVKQEQQGAPSPSVPQAASQMPNQFEENQAAIAKAYADGLIKPVYKSFADSLECPAIEVDDDEAKAQGMALAQLVALYAPSMSPDKVAWLGVVTTIGGCAFAKYLTYQAFLKEKRRKEQEAAV